MDPKRWLERLDRPRFALALSAVALLLPVIFVLAIPDPLDQPPGVDVLLYRDATARWLDGGPFYEPRQLAGPYEVAPGDILYPPIGLWLFVPLALLPTIPALVLWWGIPTAIVSLVVARLRPRPAVWPLMALCLAWPTTPLKVWTGNPVIWVVAAMAIATLWRGAAAFALLKPSLAPFALFGIRQRAWWVGAGAFVALSVPFTKMWLDWVTTVVDSRGGGLLYSSLEAPMLALPLVA
ncbi:MAG: glycosyltransferase 87 family protein, partial [Candidatus Limnocylindrales bacterium]